MIRVQFQECFGCINVIRTCPKEHNLYIEGGHFKKHHKVHDITLNLPMRGYLKKNDILLKRAEISNACKNWEKMLGKDIEWTKVFACIKKIKKLKEDDFKQRFVIEFL